MLLILLFLLLGTVVPRPFFAGDVSGGAAGRELQCRARLRAVVDDNQVSAFVWRCPCHEACAAPKAGGWQVGDAPP